MTITPSRERRYSGDHRRTASSAHLAWTRFQPHYGRKRFADVPGRCKKR